MAIKLIDYSENLSRGTILRCTGKSPYEDFVDFMVVECFNKADGNYSLMVSSGYKAGITYAVLPPESLPAGNDGYAVDLGWLTANWQKWGYFECPLNEVFVIENKPPKSVD